MMKIEIELDEARLQQLTKNGKMWRMDTDTREEAGPELLAQLILELIDFYGHRPEIVTKRHEMALTVIRAQAVEQAIRITVPGSNGHNVRHTADGIIDAMIERGW